MPSEIFSSKRPKTSPECDPSTLSNYLDFIVKHTDIKLEVDFDAKVLTGSVTFTLIPNKDINEITLDSSYLSITKAQFNDENVEFIIKPRVEPLGSALFIKSIDVKANQQSSLSLEFATTEKCTALQWLAPEQTSGLKDPYLFSQCEPIHARSLFPCFDTPAIKSTFSISVDSIYPVVVTGLAESKSESASKGSTIYKFNQKIPIPSYLFAIASGDITSASIGPRSSVFTEPLDLKKCQYEFEADTENFIKTAESIIFNYEWKEYNVLVLPPAFPYGGMENPNITFATPTLISGDRENVDVIAHELAHSWSGNLVTNSSWEHFWLNEGWTVYLERRIIGAIHGEPYRQFSAIIGWTDLVQTVEKFKENKTEYEAFTPLVKDLKDNKDPDDAFSTVPYERGFNLLYHIETKLGGKEKFDPFIPYYFNKFKYKSLDTYQFLDTLYEFFNDAESKKILDSIDWDLWLYEPGLPPKPDFDTTLVDECYDLAARWTKATESNTSTSDLFNEFNLKDIKSWTANQSVVFFDTLAEYPSWSKYTEFVRTFNKIYSSYPESNNAEVIFRWLRFNILGHVTENFQRLADWLGTVGRMKFVRPGYLLLKSVDINLAKETFEKYKSGYHPICRSLVEKDLGL